MNTKESGTNSWNGYFQGSFTIEAAVVVPLVMTALMAVIFLAIFVHDQLSLVAAAQYAALSQAEASLMGSFCAQSEKPDLSRQLIRAENHGLSVYGDASSVTAEASAAYSVPLPLADLMTGHTLRSMQVHVQDHAFNGRKKLLLYKSICDGMQDLTRGR